MIEASRRSFITGLAALVAAPAIVRAGSLMAVNSGLMAVNSGLMPDSHDHLLRELGERYWRLLEHEAELVAQQVADSVFMQGEQWPEEFARAGAGAKIGDTIRIRLPADFVRSIDVVPQIPDSLTLAAAAVAIAPVVLAKPVTRRFWAK